MFLEVACDNRLARALYDRAGYARVGRRKGYYRRAGEESGDGTGSRRVDALVLCKDLTPERKTFPDSLSGQS